LASVTTNLDLVFEDDFPDALASFHSGLRVAAMRIDPGKETPALHGIYWPHDVYGESSPPDLTEAEVEQLSLPELTDNGGDAMVRFLLCRLVIIDFGTGYFYSDQHLSSGQRLSSGQHRKSH
jgi:hypothetical protein